MCNPAFTDDDDLCLGMKKSKTTIEKKTAEEIYKTVNDIRSEIQPALYESNPISNVVPLEKKKIVKKNSKC